MIFYIQTILIPLIILFIVFLIKRKTANSNLSLINVLWVGVPFIFFYALILFFLESTTQLAAPWSFYTVLFFLIPYSLVVGLIKLINWYKNR
jgi:hypothetical protein